MCKVVCNGSRVVCNGSRVVCNGSRVVCNGSIVLVAAAILQSEPTPSLVVEKPVTQGGKHPGESSKDSK